MAFTKTQVSELYVTLMGRASEAKGNQWWQDNFTDQTKAAEAMLGSDAVKAYFGDTITADADFIANIYKNTLNKTADGADGTIADAAGIAYWTARLDGTSSEPQLTRAEMIVKFIEVARASDTVSGTQFSNRVSVSDYAAENLTDAPEGYKEALSFHNSGTEGLVVTDTATSVDAADGLIDGLAGGSEFVLTTAVDTLILTEASDTIIAESSTLGTGDTIIDVSVTDNDTMSVALTGNMVAATITNVENIDVTFNSLGSKTIDAANISGATITMGSTTFGFDGIATVDAAGKNSVTAGENITNLTVDDITTGTINTGSATTVAATTLTTGNDLNLVINGDVALTANTGTDDLKVEVTADSVLDVTASTFNDATITGTGNTTLKSDAAELTGETIKNDGTGVLTIEATDDAILDLSKVDTDKLILDDKADNAGDGNDITFKSTVDVTLKAGGNTNLDLVGVAGDTSGGTETIKADIHLTQTAAAESIALSNISEATIDAQKGGTIALINGDIATTATTNTTADVTLLNSGEVLLTVTSALLENHSLVIDGASTGDVTVAAFTAATLNAANFEKELKVTETASSATPVMIIGGKGKNTIETTTTAAATTIRTQDAVDTLTIATVAGKLTVETAGGDDVLTATALTNSVATLDLGDGNDTLTVKQVATVTTGKVTINGGAGDDIIKIESTSSNKGTSVIDGGDGTDTIDVKDDSDFTAATLDWTAENLKIDTDAIFLGSQLDAKTFNVSSGTSGVDTLTVKDIETDTDLSTLNFSSSTATSVDYTLINTKSGIVLDTEVTIKGTHNSANVITLQANAKETVQLFADGTGTTISDLQAGATTDLVATDLSGIDSAKTSFDIAVITAFDTAKDSLILGNAATADNYTEETSAIDRSTTAGSKGIEEQLGATGTADSALKIANDAMQADANLEYVYVSNVKTDAGKSGTDAFLMWDSDGDHNVDSAILLVGIDSFATPGAGFAASDIIAG